MDVIDAIDIIGLKKAISRSFSSVFGELNEASEAWFQKTKLLTVGRENYANFMANKVGIFPLFATNKSASVDTAYIRVDVSTDIERDRYRSRVQIERDLKRRRLGADADHQRRQSGETPIGAISSTSGGFALIGMPGSGKTTIFRSIAVQSARGKPIRGRARIPIYLAVRDLSSDSQGIADACEALFKDLGIKESGRVFESLLKSGNCIILLDGLDETSNTHRTALLQELLELKAKHNSCVYCISARPFSLSVGIPDFLKWETLPLSFSERLSFVKKWFSLVDPSKGERLIEKSQSRPEILDLGSNPLLLSIVCALFHNDLDIPSETDELYERAIHGLLGGWDAFRNIARNTILASVPIKKRLVLVSWLGASLYQAGKLVFTPAEVTATKILSQASEVLQISPIDSDDLLETLYNDFGLLVERSPGLYSFSHLTIHEYLVAKYIVDNRQEIELLNSFRSDQKWEQIVRLVAKMLPSADVFMSNLQDRKALEDPDRVRLLESVWLSKPICSLDLRKKLLTQMAMKISGVASRYSTFEVSSAPTGDVLVIGIQPPNEKDDATYRLRIRYLFPPFMTNILPSLLRIIKSSGFDYPSLGVRASKLFQVLATAKSDEFAGVTYVNKHTGQPIQIRSTGEPVLSDLTVIEELRVCRKCGRTFSASIDERVTCPFCGSVVRAL